MPREFSRTLRLNAQIQRELSELIRDELSDPRVAQLPITVTQVDVSPDLRNARVSVSLLGADEKLAAAVKVLNGASAHIRHRLGKRLRLRMVPTPHFVADIALREGDRIGALIRQATAEDHAAEPEPGDEQS
jgi:ribosome-binding factor A